MRKITSIILTLVVALLGMLPQVAYAAEEGTSAGSFTITNQAPSVSVVEIYTDSGLTGTTSSLTPQVMYFCKVTVSDANTLDDISQIKLKIFYDSTPSDPLESTITVGANNGAAIITWTKAGSVWAIDAGAATSWTVETGSCVTPTMTASSGDWVIALKVGKVATESPGADNWDFHARATDAGALTSGLYNRDKNVLWYGQITVNTGSVSFGSVTPGTGFADNVNEYNTISTNWTSNGNFDEKVKSTATWTGGTYTATLDDTGGVATANKFALKAWSSDTFGSAVLVDATGVVIYTTPHAQTTESGDTNTANTLWLKLASIFQIDTYSGTITYIIANN